MSVLTTARQPDKSDLLASFTNGVAPDAHLFAQEIAVQKAWAQGLADINYLTPDELKKILNALDKAQALMQEHKFDWRIEDEDIHMNIERFVNDEAHGLGKKMHIGRSRNDLIATTLRLHSAGASEKVVTQLQTLIESLIKLAESNQHILIPGMTHLQNGQPVRFAHAILGHAWGLKRAQKKFLHAQEEALEAMPLGSAALAGTTIPINLNQIAQKLGFKHTAHNSYDAVGDRDFVLSFLQASAYLGSHLSRIAEDIIYWASAPVGLVKLSPQWSTGSSIMPNKRNPDVAELTRAKASLWMGDAHGVLTLLKGLATSYASDLHETKIPYLRVCQDVQLTLNVFTPFCEELTVQADAAQVMLNRGHILATEIADNFTAKGIPFRDAYGMVAELVQKAEALGKQVHELYHEEKLSFESAVEKRDFPGGTSLRQLQLQIKELKTL